MKRNRSLLGLILSLVLIMSVMISPANATSGTNVAATEALDTLATQTDLSKKEKSLSLLKKAATAGGINSENKDITLSLPKEQEDGSAPVIDGGAEEHTALMPNTNARSMGNQAKISRIESQLAQIESISDEKSRNSIQPFASAYYMEQGYWHVGTLANGNDFNQYYSVVPQTGDIVVRMQRHPDAWYVVDVYREDANGNLTVTSNYITPNISDAQVRLYAEAGDFIVAEVWCADGYVNPSWEYQIGYIPAGARDSREPNDSFWDTNSQQINLPNNITLSGTLDNVWDMDWYKVSLAANHELALNFSNNCNAYGTVYQEVNGGLQPRGNFQAGALMVLAKAPEARTLYFVFESLSGNTGTYSLKLKQYDSSAAGTQVEATVTSDLGVMELMPSVNWPNETSLGRLPTVYEALQVRATAKAADGTPMSNQRLALQFGVFGTSSNHVTMVGYSDWDGKYTFNVDAGRPQIAHRAWYDSKNRVYWFYTTAEIRIYNNYASGLGFSYHNNAYWVERTSPDPYL